MKNEKNLPPLALPRFTDCSTEDIARVIHGISLDRERFIAVSRLLVENILQYPTPCFLLAAVLEFIQTVNDAKVIAYPFSLNGFELWLNQYAGLSDETKRLIRGKIVGRYVPKDEYQRFFPVGSGKSLPGSHVVAAHIAPDTDSLVASFWGWVDAFGCAVGSGIHRWSLPAGPHDGYVHLFFQEIFGKNFFAQVPMPLPAIALQAIDLVTQKNVHTVRLTDTVESIDHEEHGAVLVVDTSGSYCGEWRIHDAEAVGHIVSGFFHCLRWLEGKCQSELIHVLAKPAPLRHEVESAYMNVFSSSVRACAAAIDVPHDVRIHEYMMNVIHLPKGIDSSFLEVFDALDKLAKSSLRHVVEHCAQLLDEAIYVQGVLSSDRTKVIHVLEMVVHHLRTSLQTVRQCIGTLEHQMACKERLLQSPPASVPLRSDIEHIRSAIGDHDYITVVLPEGEKWIALGVIYASDVHRPILGTASFRDFSNAEETKMASYIDVVSVIDHHKTRCVSASIPSVILADTQSCNTLVAEQSLAINMLYGKNGLREVLPESAFTLFDVRLDIGDFFVDPLRELCEYYSCLFAIFDDTDLLTKVSRRDVMCVRAIVRRIGTLLQKPTDIPFEAILQDGSFAKKAAALLLESPHVHALYAQVYAFREEEVEKAIIEAEKGKISSIFTDTKEQNGCCRGGQTKLFVKNIPVFHKASSSIQSLWIHMSQKIFDARPQIDLFLHMITTIPSADEVFCGQKQWSHSDQLWIWAPKGELPEQHLAVFLQNFMQSPDGQSLQADICVKGECAREYAAIVDRCYTVARSICVEECPQETVIEFTFPAGKITSRKAQISPYLPKVV